MVGPCSVYHKGLPCEPEELISTMQRFSIERAIVYHSLSREVHPSMGDPQLLQVCEGNKELVPVFCLLPLDEVGGVETFVNTLKSNNVRAVRAFPAASVHNFILSPVTCGPLLEALQELSIPLFIDYSNNMYNPEPIPFQLIWELGEAFPRLPMVLCNTGYRLLRDLIPTMKRINSLYLEISRFAVHRGLEELAGLFGVHRLLFGTGLPYYDPGAPIAAVTYADLAFEDKICIARGNLEDLIERVKF